MKSRVLFVCTGNSARSQMAEALLRGRAGARYDVCSAGTNPRGLHALAIEAMRELGIDIGGQRSKDLQGFAGQKFDYVITVCDSARQQCPVFPGAHSIHWDLQDPAAVTGDSQAQMRAFRRTRDQLRQLVEAFIAGKNIATNGRQ